MSLVIDSSMTLAWYFEDEKAEESTAVLNQVVAAGATVPAHWRLEVLNGLQVAVRRGRITAAYRDASLAEELCQSCIRQAPGDIRGSISASRSFGAFGNRFD